MEKNAILDTIFIPSEDIVSRDIEGELVIVPLAAGIGDLEDELYTLNETGRIIWDKMNGENTIKNIIEDIKGEYKGEDSEIENDVVGLVEELLKRKIIVEFKKR